MFCRNRAFLISARRPARDGTRAVQLQLAEPPAPDTRTANPTPLSGVFEAIAHHLSKFLPTVHGFDAFFGYLYHLDAMSDPYWYGYPQEWLDTVGPRHLIHSYATNMNDATVQPRLGRIGKQRIRQAGGDGGGFPADAGPGVVQSVGGEKAGGRADQGARGAVGTADAGPHAGRLPRWEA